MTYGDEGPSTTGGAAEEPESGQAIIDDFEVDGESPAHGPHRPGGAGICPECGEETEGRRFCTSCGASISDQDPAPIVPEVDAAGAADLVASRRRSKSAIRWAVVPLTILLAAGGAYAAVDGNGNKTKNPPDNAAQENPAKHKVPRYKPKAGAPVVAASATPLPAPGKPYAVTLTQGENPGELQATWSAPSNAATSKVWRYDVFTQASGAKPACSRDVNPPLTTTCVMRNLDPSQPYRAQVVASNEQDQSTTSDWSEHATPKQAPSTEPPPPPDPDKDPPPPPPPPDPAPPAPTAVEAESQTSSEITLTWRASDTAKSYLIRQSPADASQPWEVAAESSCLDGDCSDTVSGLTAGTLYSFEVVAKNDAGESAPEEVKGVTGTSPSSVTATLDPATESATTDGSPSSPSVKLTWTVGTETTEPDLTTSYEIQRKTENGDWKTLQDGLPAGTSEYLDATADPGETYVYRVVAHIVNVSSPGVAIASLPASGQSEPLEVPASSPSASSIESPLSDTSDFGDQPSADASVSPSANLSGAAAPTDQPSTPSD